MKILQNGHFQKWLFLFSNTHYLPFTEQPLPELLFFALFINCVNSDYTNFTAVP